MKYNLYNGDCLEEMKSIPDESIDAIITDPPYLYLKNQDFDKAFDEDGVFNECKRILKKSGFIVLFGRGTSFYRWNYILDKLGFTFKEEIIWNKKMTSTIFNPISRTHETISVYTKENGKINNVKVPYTVARKYDLQNIVNDVKRIKGALKNDKKLEIVFVK